MDMKCNNSLGFYLKNLLIIWVLLFQYVTDDVDAAPTNSSSTLRMPLPFEDCGSKYQVLYLEIDSCTKIPCCMKRNTFAKVTVLFDAYGNDISFLKHKVRWTFNYVHQNATIRPDPCDGNHACISDANKGKTYWADIFVNDSLPVMRGTMIWEAVNQNNVKLICFEVPIIITV